MRLAELFAMSDDLENAVQRTNSGIGLTGEELVFVEIKATPIKLSWLHRLLGIDYRPIAVRYKITTMFYDAQSKAVVLKGKYE